MAEAYIIPLPPRWERDLDCGWVEFKSGRDDIRGYLAKPKGKRNLPGIIMIHENLGVIEHRQDVTRRLAKAGYAVLTVDLYSRIGGQSPRDFTTPEERRIKAFRAMPDEQVVPDLEAGCRYLEALDSVDGKRIGTVGYCSGGGLLYGWVLGKSTNVKCAVVYYGTTAMRPETRPDGKPLERLPQALKLQCPIQVHQGEADRMIDGVRAMIEGLKQSGRTVEFFTYPGADHAYDDDTHPAYHAAASKLSWSRAIEFLGRHLGSASAGG
ncbi:MAG TPA: dienelactone hydrolase family protein [Stellaceae bacterium]|jgi:carboxymethylenebutenolidase|nr:dienelactone hydrolase family protein [Stellaceae bacterium]